MNLFTGEKVRLTQLERSDLDVFLGWFRDYDVQRFLMPAAVPMTVERETEWLDHALTTTDSHHFSIRLLGDDRLIGNCSLFNLDHRSRKAEFGIVIGETDAWGQGYGTDATRVMLHFAFDELNLHRVELDVYDFNQRGIRAYEKAGFVHEGTLRQAMYREGAYHDIHKMGVLRSDWQEATRR